MPLTIVEDLPVPTAAILVQAQQVPPATTTGTETTGRLSTSEEATLLGVAGTATERATMAVEEAMEEAVAGTMAIETENTLVAMGAIEIMVGALGGTAIANVNVNGSTNGHLLEEVSLTPVSHHAYQLA